MNPYEHDTNKLIKDYRNSSDHILIKGVIIIAIFVGVYLAFAIPAQRRYTLARKTYLDPAFQSYEKGDYAAAVQDYKRYFLKFPGSHNYVAYYNLAMAQAKLGELKEARASFVNAATATASADIGRSGHGDDEFKQQCDKQIDEIDKSIATKTQ